MVVKYVSFTMLDDIGACVHLLSVGFIVSSAASFKPSSIPTFVLDTRLLEEAWFRFGGSFLPVSIVAWTAALKLCKTSLEVVVLRARQVAP
jgi:hypothetical protein